MLCLSKAGDLGRPFDFTFFNKTFLVLGCSFLHLGYFGIDLTSYLRKLYIPAMKKIK